jgi:hypothetical protein
MLDPEPGRQPDGRPYLLWRLDRPWRALSTAPLGGGWGERSWVLNAQVALDYGRTDPDAHLAEMASGAGLSGAGVGMMTAADLTLISRFADRLVLVDGGRVVAGGTPEEILTPETLARWYGANVRVIQDPTGPVIVPLRPLREAE